MARIVQRTPRFTIRFLVIIIKVVKGGGGMKWMKAETTQMMMVMPMDCDKKCTIMVRRLLYNYRDISGAELYPSSLIDSGDILS